MEIVPLEHLLGYQDPQTSMLASGIIAALFVLFALRVYWLQSHDDS